MSVLVNYYNVLGIEKDADAPAVKTAYRGLVKSCHPDLHPNDPAAKASFQQLQDAYATLSDETKRAYHDFELRHRNTASGSDRNRANDNNPGFNTGAAARASTPPPKPQAYDMTGTKVVADNEYLARRDKIIRSEFNWHQRLALKAHPWVRIDRDNVCGVSLRHVFSTYAGIHHLQRANADGTTGYWRNGHGSLFSQETVGVIDYYTTHYRVPKRLRAKFADASRRAFNDCANYRGVVNQWKR